MKLKNWQYELCLYLMLMILASITLFSWEHKNISTMTGDEPHYLIISDSIINDKTFDVTKAYKREFEKRAIYKGGLANKEAMPDESNTHAIASSHGLFSVHNVGLSILLAIPFKYFGVLGAKFFLVLAISLLVILIYKFVLYYTNDNNLALLLAFSISFSQPIILGANQIYPDLLAGIISLYALYILYQKFQNPMSACYVNFNNEIFLSAFLSYLPWLHIKNILPALILVLGNIYLCRKDKRNILINLSIFVFSILLLMLYNYYAYDNFFGPYRGKGLTLNDITAVKVFLGLHFDQHHGMVFQNPLWIIGFLFIGKYIKENKIYSLIVITLYFSFIVPNSLHGNWYGGWSFSGRFMWAAYVTFIPITAYGLMELFKIEKKLFYFILFLSIAYQLIVYIDYSFVLKDLYNLYNLNGAKNIAFISNNFLPLFPIKSIKEMPLYLYVDVVYILFFIFIVIYNFNDKINLKNFYIFTTFLIFLVVIINLLYPNTSNKIYYNASELPSQTGRLLNNIRCADKDDKEGFLTYGPYIKLKHGKKYKFNLIYSSNQNNNNIVGFWDVYCGRGNVINNGELKGTNGGKTSIDGSFMLKENCLAEIRSFFKGSGDLCVWSLEILE